MMNVKNSILLLVFLAGMASCAGDKILSPEEYLSYFNNPENPFVKTKEFNKVVYKLRMQPPQYMILRNGNIKTADAFNTEFEKNKDILCFVLMLEDEPGSAQVKEVVYKSEQFSKLGNYSNMQMLQDVCLLAGNDTLACTALHLDPANSIRPVIRFAFAFNGVNPADKNYTLVFNDNLFNNGQIRFAYSNETLDQLPTLKF